MAANPPRPQTHPPTPRDGEHQAGESPAPVDASPSGRTAFEPSAPKDASRGQPAPASGASAVQADPRASASPIRVRILQLGRRVVEHAAPPGATLAATLEAAGFGALPLGIDVRVNGAPAPASLPLQNRDVVTLVPRIKGGRARARDTRRRGGERPAGAPRTHREGGAARAPR